MATGIQISPSSDITIGTTAISSGTEGRILFQGAGNVVQQDAGLFWDNTNKRLQLFKSTGATIRLNTSFSDQQFLQFTQEFSPGVATQIGYVSNQFGTGMILNTQNDIIFQPGNTDKGRFTSTGQLVIGSTTAGARLDVRAQGALSTDIALRVRNSANTANFLTVNGAGDVFNNGAGGVTTNTFYGENVGRAASGVYNTGFGYQSLMSVTSGVNNTSIGLNSLLLTTAGTNNTSIGTESMRVNINGIYNTSIGSSALYSSLSSYSTAIGGLSAQSQTSGGENVAIGFSALNKNTTGTNNTSIGTNSLLNAIGSNNISLGHSAGRLISGGTNLTSSNNSIFIGQDSRANANGETNQIVIGHNAIGLGSNTSVIGNSSTTRWKLWGVGLLENITAPSTSVTDNFHFYSADIVAGNAAPHFRTEAGDIIKLYKQTSTGTETVADVVQYLKNLGLLS